MVSHLREFCWRVAELSTKGFDSFDESSGLDRVPQVRESPECCLTFVEELPVNSVLLLLLCLPHEAVASNDNVIELGLLLVIDQLPLLILERVRVDETRVGWQRHSGGDNLNSLLQELRGLLLGLIEALRSLHERLLALHMLLDTLLPVGTVASLQLRPFDPSSVPQDFLGVVVAF
jgi:hypothetical protein